MRELIVNVLKIHWEIFKYLWQFVYHNDRDLRRYIKKYHFPSSNLYFMLRIKIEAIEFMRFYQFLNILCDRL